MVSHIFKPTPSHFGPSSAQPCVGTGRVALLLSPVVVVSLLENSSLCRAKSHLPTLSTPASILFSVSRMAWAQSVLPRLLLKPPMGLQMKETFVKQNRGQH